MKTMTYLWAAGALATWAALTSPASAVVVTWNTCNGDGALNDCDIDPPGPGNAFSIVESPRTVIDPVGSNNDSMEFTETVDAVARVLKATGHRTDTTAGGASATAILPAEMNIFEGGLGVHWEIDGAPDESDSSPHHAVDNIGFDELVLFEFADAEYEPISFMTGWSCAFGTDNDSTCEFGGTNDILTFIGGDGILAAFLNFLQTGTVLAGFTAELFDDVAIGDPQFFTQGGSGKFLIIAAASATHEETSVSNVTFPTRHTGITGDTAKRNFCSSTYAASNRSNFGFTNVTGGFKCKWKETTTIVKDGGGAFKIAQIVGELVERDVPAPMTLALFGAGLVGLGAVRRKAA